MNHLRHFEPKERACEGLCAADLAHPASFGFCEQTLRLAFEIDLDQSGVSA
jgi:hypothetical protein